MPRPEGYASMQFDQVESTGKQVMVQCRHCHNKRLARSVASRKVKHLQQCADFKRYLAELAAEGNEELNDVPPELLHGSSASSASNQNRGNVGYRMTQTPPVRRQFDVSLPTLLDGLGSARRDELATPLDEIRDFNRGLDEDETMDEPTNEPIPRPAPRVVEAPDSVPERAVAFAHRAAQRRKERLDNVLTRAIYEGSLPFNVSDPLKHPAMAEFFRLVDYVPPNRHRIADDVYDHAYDQTDNTIPYAS